MKTKCQIPKKYSIEYLYLDGICREVVNLINADYKPSIKDYLIGHRETLLLIMEELEYKREDEETYEYLEVGSIIEFIRWLTRNHISELSLRSDFHKDYAGVMKAWGDLLK